MEIKIGKMARACAACQRPFVHEQPLNSLVRIEDGQFVREDYCDACWEPERAKGAFSVWTRRYYDPDVAEQEPPETFSPLRKLFYEAVESEDRRELAKAYLAAQLLRRQKVFRLIKESDDSEEEVRLALFEDRIGGRLIEVRDPSLTYPEMEEGRQALVTRLSELENPEPAESAPETDEPGHDSNQQVEEDAQAEEAEISAGQG